MQFLGGEIGQKRIGHFAREENRPGVVRMCEVNESVTWQRLRANPGTVLLPGECVLDLPVDLIDCVHENRIGR
jgi:hypothetical protein